jgi:hypothetical protein
MKNHKLPIFPSQRPRGGGQHRVLEFNEKAYIGEGQGTSGGEAGGAEADDHEGSEGQAASYLDQK